MKIYLDHSQSRRRESGLATLIFIVLLGLMLILAMSNVRTLLHLRAEENLMEQKQIQRLNMTQTNAVAVVQSLLPPQSK